MRSVFEKLRPHLRRELSAFQVGLVLIAFSGAVFIYLMEAMMKHSPSAPVEWTGYGIVCLLMVANLLIGMHLCFIRSAPHSSGNTINQYGKDAVAVNKAERGMFAADKHATGPRKKKAATKPKRKAANVNR